MLAFRKLIKANFNRRTKCEQKRKRLKDEFPPKTITVILIDVTSLSRQYGHRFRAKKEGEGAKHCLRNGSNNVHSFS